jgi:hypothetical protein
MPTAVLGFSLTGTGVVPVADSTEITYTGAAPGLRLELTGSQVYEVDLAMMPAEGLRGLLVIVEAVDQGGNPIAAPVVVRWTSNAVEKEEELAPGVGLAAFFLLCSPAPTAGITALEIESTADAVVIVHALG